MGARPCSNRVPMTPKPDDLKIPNRNAKPAKKAKRKTKAKKK